MCGYILCVTEAVLYRELSELSYLKFDHGGLLLTDPILGSNLVKRISLDAIWAVHWILNPLHRTGSTNQELFRSLNTAINNYSNNTSMLAAFIERIIIIKDYFHPTLSALLSTLYIMKMNILRFTSFKCHLIYAHHTTTHGEEHQECNFSHKMQLDSFCKHL